MTRSRRLLHITSMLTTSVIVLCFATAVAAEPFTYNPPGELVSGSGTGRVDDKVYVPGMQFPIEVAPAYPNSQVYGVGGLYGPSGGQCDTRNYSYPWSDNYCEKRSWDVPLCPGGNGHQGQDIRPSTCEKDVHWVVSAEAGTVTQIGTYSVYVVSANGTRHRYLHMEPSSLTVKVNDSVQMGQRLGRVSNAFGGTPTSIHLHYDIYQTISGVGPTYVPTYMSLVRSYERLLGTPAEPCAVIDATGDTIDDKSPCFRLLGKLQYWRTVNDAGVDGRLYWTYAFSGSAPSAYARWSFDFAEAGKYTLQVHTPAMYNESKQARYGLKVNGRDEEVILDMTTSSAWHDLGTWTFAKGGEQHLELYDNTGEATDLKRKMVADAIRLVRVDEMPPPEDMGMDMPDTKDMTPDLGEEDMGQPVADMTRDLTMKPDAGSSGDPGTGPKTVSSSTCQSVPAPNHVPLWLWLIAGVMLRGAYRKRRSVV